MHFETPHNEIECVLSVKESNFNENKRSKFSHLLTVRAEVADPPPPYGQPDRKISTFFTPSLNEMSSKMSFMSLQHCKLFSGRILLTYFLQW